MAEYGSPQANEKRLKRFSTAIFFSSFIRRDMTNDGDWPAQHAGMSAQAMVQERKRDAWSRPVRPHGRGSSR